MDRHGTNLPNTIVYIDKELEYKNLERSLPKEESSSNTKIFSSKEIFSLAIDELNKFEDDPERRHTILNELINILMLRMELGGDNYKIRDYYPDWIRNI